MASKTTATSGRAIRGSKASTAWCSLVSIQIRSLSSRALFKDSWASRRRIPPISTMLLPPSSRQPLSLRRTARARLSTSPARNESPGIDRSPAERAETRLEIVALGEHVDHRQQELADLAVAGRDSFPDDLVHDLDQLQPVVVTRRRRFECASSDPECRSTCGIGSRDCLPTRRRQIRCVRGGRTSRPGPQASSARMKRLM